MTLSNGYGHSAQPRVLVCDPLHPDAIAYLSEHAHVDVIGTPKLTQLELEERIETYHGVINRSRTPIPEDVIRRGTHLRAIVRAGAGLDNIDVAVADELGIAVANCPGINAVAVAEHTFALMLGLARHIGHAHSSMKAGEWKKSAFTGSELHSKTLGIIGFGHIGREVAKRAVAFDMNVVVNQNRLTPELASEWRVETVDLYELLENADFVTLHVPLRAANRGLISAKELRCMKPSAYLVNTSRGGIVDEAALLAALDDEEITGAALDVFENEPGINPALGQHPKVLATPHIGASTVDAQRNAGMVAAQHMVEALKQPSPAEALSLRLVPVEQVFPHETYHEPRVARLAKDLADDDFLANPPLVAELPDKQGYVVLDGATRTTAFKQLGYPHMVVQVVDLQRSVQLFSWSHAVRDCYGNGGASALLEKIQETPGVRLVSRPMTELNEAMHNENALGYVVTDRNEGFLLEVDEAALPSEEHDWLYLINAMVEQYGQWGDVERTLKQEIKQLKSMYTDFAALFVFPAYTPDIVLQLVAQGRLLPAGITRFVIPGRLLRLNFPLEHLRSDAPLSLKQDELDQFVEMKLGGRSIRYYEEPVVLLDE